LNATELKNDTSFPRERKRVGEGRDVKKRHLKAECKKELTWGKGAIVVWRRHRREGGTKEGNEPR